MESRNKFSIVIPAYKQSYLKEAIDSCFEQYYQNFEVIVVNDASPENLDSIVSLYDDSRLRYYKNEKNCGAINVVNNWNKCLEYATGNYIICMGDDDRLLPCCLEEYNKLIKQYPNLGVYHAWTEIIDENGNFYKLQHPRPLYEGPYSLCWNRWYGRGLQFIGDFCFDTKKLRDDGGFYCLPMAWASDDITAVRAARYKGIANTQRICCQYRENRQSISSSGSQIVKMNATVQEKEWYQNFIKKELPFNDIEIKYKKLVEEGIDNFFVSKMKIQISLDMKGRYWRFFYWVYYMNRYSLSLFVILSAFCKTLKESCRSRL